MATLFKWISTGFVILLCIMFWQWTVIGLGCLIIWHYVSMFMKAVAHRRKCRGEDRAIGSIWHHYKIVNAELVASEAAANEKIKAELAAKEDEKKLQRQGKENSSELALVNADASSDISKQHLPAMDSSTSPIVAAVDDERDHAISLAKPSVINNEREKDKPTKKIIETITRGWIALPDSISFSYTDSKGDISHRTIKAQVVNINSRGESYFEGYCSQAQARRTFRIDRVIGFVTRIKNGEMLTPSAWLAAVDDAAPRRRLSIAASLSMPKERQTAVLFTGFRQERRNELESLADAEGWWVRQKVSGTLDFLVTGPHGGPAKIRDAESNGVQVITEAEFLLRCGG